MHRMATQYMLTYQQLLQVSWQDGAGGPEAHLIPPTQLGNTHISVNNSGKDPKMAEQTPQLKAGKWNSTTKGWKVGG